MPRFPENGELHCQRWGHEFQPDSGGSEDSIFNEAPRSMRIDSVGKIPELLRNLVQVAHQTAEKTKNSVVEAKQLTNAFIEAAKLWPLQRPKAK